MKPETVLTTRGLSARSVIFNNLEDTRDWFLEIVFLVLYEAIDRSRDVRRDTSATRLTTIPIT